jgi:DivIVA domain-containing protein
LAEPLAGNSPGVTNDVLVDQVSGSRFRTTTFRQGYDMAQVDDFLDRLVAALRAGEPVRPLVDAARFATTKLRAGYDMGDVDDLLASVARDSATG